MRTTSQLFIAVFTFLALATSAYAQSPREQLNQMVQQLQKNPGDNALREKIIRLAAGIKPVPAVPEDARRAFVRGNTAFTDAKTAADFARAAALFEEASNIAPWWADAYFNLAKTREAQKDYAGALRALQFHLALPLPSADKRQAQDLVYALEEKRDRKKAGDAEASALERFVGTWSQTVMSGDREFHRRFTISRDGAGLKMSVTTETEVGGRRFVAVGKEPPYDIVMRGGDLEFKTRYFVGETVMAVGVVVFTVSADGRRITARQTFLPFTPSQQAHWKEWGQPGSSYGEQPWTKD